MKIRLKAGSGFRSAGLVSGNGDRSSACVVSCCKTHVKFLRECVESISGQTVPFSSVHIEADDCLEEVSKVCGEFSSASALSVSGGVYGKAGLTKDAGVKKSPKSEFVVCVDADDTIERDFHEKLNGTLYSANKSVAGAYPRIERYLYPSMRKISPGRFNVNYDRLKLISGQMWLPAPTLLRRRAYDIAGGFRGEPIISDHSLWCRMSDMGMSFVYDPSTAYNYRRHDESMHVSSTNEGTKLRMVVDSYKTFANICVVTPACRSWGVAPYSKSIKSLGWNPERITACILYTGENPADGRGYEEACRALGIDFYSARGKAGELMGATLDSKRNRQDNRDQFNGMIWGLYGKLKGMVPMKAHYVMTLEDDIEMPEGALDHMMYMLAKDPDSACCSGFVKSRFGGHWMMRLPEDKEFSGEPEHGKYYKIWRTGTHCTLWRMSAWNALPGYVVGGSSGIKYGDIADYGACGVLASEKYNLWASGSARCKHWMSDMTTV